MKLLIINVDDCGLSESVNEAVETCYQAGRITGTSITSAGAYFQQAAAMLRSIGKADVGAHLTLTGEFTPHANYRSFGLRYLLRKVKSDQVYREFRVQIEKILREGLQITHLDSHEHVHMFPGVFKIVLQLALEFNIPYIRIPLEKMAVVTKNFSVGDFMRYTGLRGFAAGAEKQISRTALKCNDGFWGHFHSGRITDDIFLFMMENLVEGVTELVIHPSISGDAGLREFDVLMAGRWKKRVLEELGIKLVSHREIV